MTFYLTNQSFRSKRSLISGVSFTTKTDQKSQKVKTQKGKVAAFCYCRAMSTCGQWQLLAKHFFNNRSFARMYIFEERNFRNSCNVFPHSRDSRPGFQAVHPPPSVRSLFIVRVGCFEPFPDFSSDMIQFWTFSLQQIPFSNPNSLELEF